MSRPDVPIQRLSPVETGREYFFGYYDKCPWNASQGRVLTHRVPFARRMPTAGDEADLGLLDPRRPGHFEKVASTYAWCWQQGAMLQWDPAGPEDTILYNAREDGGFVGVRQHLPSGQRVMLPRPFAAVSHEGNRAISLNFSRLAALRPGYGYEGVPDPFADEPCPREDGLYRVDLDTHQQTLIVSLADLAGRAPLPSMEGAFHWVNHALFSPDDRRFAFVHRWQPDEGPFRTRLYTAALDGGEPRCLNDAGLTSHYDWAGPGTLVAWNERAEAGRVYSRFADDGSGRVETLGGRTLRPYGDGHCSFSPNGRWMLTDSYPDPDGYRHLLLYDPLADRVHPLGRFDRAGLPRVMRCDLHPRWSRDGRRICFDSSRTGQRAVYSAEITKVLAEAEAGFTAETAAAGL